MNSLLFYLKSTKYRVNVECRRILPAIDIDSSFFNSRAALLMLVMSTSSPGGHLEIPGIPVAKARQEA